MRGGNFGVVTPFLFRLHPIDTVYARPIFWSLDYATEVLQGYQEFITAASEEMNAFFAFLKVPPAPPFPEALHGQTVWRRLLLCRTTTTGRKGGAATPLPREPEHHASGVTPHLAWCWRQRWRQSSTLLAACAWFYRLWPGWSLGKRFLLLTHGGRKSGRATLPWKCYAIQHNPKVISSVGERKRPACAAYLSIIEGAHAEERKAW